MTAHLQVPAWDSRPATLSAVALGDWLRRRLGFQGVIMTDDLEMGAIAGAGAVPDAAGQALAAGADLLLICSPADMVWEAARRRSRDSALTGPAAEVKRRLHALRTRLARAPADLEAVKAYFQKR